MQVHKHFLLRNADPARGQTPQYWQVQAIEESSPYHLQFLVATWKGEEIRDYFSMIQSSPGMMTFIMHDRLSSALAEAEKIVSEAVESGEWMIEES